MRAIRSTGNRTETALRKVLHSLGLRYRIYARNVVGKPDFVFPRQRVAVFVDGDYWHARALREERSPLPLKRLAADRYEYWSKKFETRILRDDYVTAELSRQGWLVLRYWESEVKSDLRGVASKIADTVRRRK